MYLCILHSQAVALLSDPLCKQSMKSSTAQLPHNDEEITEQTLLAFMNLMKQELEAAEPPSVPPTIANTADDHVAFSRADARNAQGHDDDSVQTCDMRLDTKGRNFGRQNVQSRVCKGGRGRARGGHDAREW